MVLFVTVHVQLERNPDGRISVGSDIWWWYNGAAGELESSCCPAIRSPYACTNCWTSWNCSGTGWLATAKHQKGPPCL